MSIERTFFCDGPVNNDIPGDEPQPDGCPHKARATMIDPDYLPGGTIEVRYHVQGKIEERLHFCCWDCLMRYAAKKHPVEYFEGLPDGFTDGSDTGGDDAV